MPVEPIPKSKETAPTLDGLAHRNAELQQRQQQLEERFAKLEERLGRVQRSKRPRQPGRSN